MAFDSTIRLRQMNQPELSGFIVPIILSLLAGTGNLSGAFYPLNSNPSGYEQSGAFVDQVTLDSAIFQLSSYVNQSFYPNSNPSGFAPYNILQFASLPISANCSFGVDTQFIGFPLQFSGIPRVTCSFVNNIDNNIYSLSISGVSTSGFFVNYSNTISSVGYSINAIADYSSLSNTFSSFFAYCNSGTNSQYVSFPTVLAGIPKITCSFVNNIDTNLYLFSISGVNTSGFYVNYSDMIAGTGYQLSIIANL